MLSFLFWILALTAPVAPAPAAVPDASAAPASAPALPTTAPPAAGDAAGPRISGVVAAEEDGKPLAGARIDLYLDMEPDAMRERLLAGQPFVGPIATTHADGAGRFQVRAPVGLRVVLVAEGSGSVRTRILRPSVLTADRDLGTIELPPGRRIAGRVVDQTGRPLSGVLLAAQLPKWRTATDFRRKIDVTPFMALATSGADGTFAITGAPRRPVTLRALKEHLAPAAIDSVRSSAAVEIKMTPGRSVSGRVTRPDGSPASRAWVLAGDDGWDGLSRVGADGTFRIERVRLGSIRLTATSEDDAPSAPAKVSIAAPPKPAPADLFMKLRPGGTVRMSIFDAETRRLIAGAEAILDLEGEQNPALRVADAQGHALFAGVPAGRLTLRAQAEGYRDASLAALPLVAGQVRDASLALEPAASLAGTIVDDLGRPVAGALVNVTGPPDFGGFRVASYYVPIDGVEPVKSDAHGRFVLDQLPPRDGLKIRITHRDYAPWETTGIRLKPSERRTGLDIRLQPGVAITGRLTDAAGRPVAGAAIVAEHHPDDDTGGMFIRMRRGGGRKGPASPEEHELPQVQSDAKGGFRLGGASAGIWSLAIDAKGFAPRSLEGLKVDGTRGLDVGAVALVPGARIKGRVVGPAGEPVPFAHGAVKQEFETLSEFVTTSDGRFETDDMAAGEAVTLAIEADGYSDWDQSGLKPPVADLVVTLHATSSITGQVTDQESGQPVPDFSITVSRSRMAGSSTRSLGWMDVQAELAFHTDDGTFQVERIDPGRVMVSAVAPGYRAAELSDVEVPEKGRAEGVVLALPRAALLSGTVTDEAEHPIQGARVSRQAAASGFGSMRLSSRDDSTYTDGEGAFALDGMEPGSIVLSFTHDDYEPATLEVDAGRDRSRLRVQMTKGVALQGIVRRDSDGSPVGGATVVASGGGSSMFGGLSAETGPDGSFLLEAVPPGRYSVQATAPGLRSAKVENLVLARGTAPPPLELRLSGGVTVTGTVTGIPEAERGKCTVYAVEAGGGGFHGPTPVDASGRFELKGLPAGTLTLTASSDQLAGASVSRQVEIPDDVSTFDTSLEFPSGAVVQGVVRRGGQPLGGAAVAFWSPASRTRSSGVTDASGHYSVSGIQTGDNQVDVMQFTAGVSFETSVTVDGDRSFDIDLPLAHVSGIVREAGSGKPIASASVTIGPATADAPAVGFFQKSATTDANGSFIMGDLQAGAYQLTARKEGFGYETHPITLEDGQDAPEAIFELSKVGTVNFRAVDGLSGSPLRSLRALVLSGGGDPLDPGAASPTLVFQGRLSADPGGLFHLESLQPGTYTLVLGADGEATETITDLAAPAAEFAVTLSAPGVVVVKSAGPDSTDTAQAILIDAGGHIVYRNAWSSDADFLLPPGGSVSLANVKPGAYRVRAAFRDGIVEKPVQVRAGETATVTVP